MYKVHSVNKPRRVIKSIDELPVLCDAAEAALLLRLTPERVAKMAVEGMLPGAKQGNRWFFRRDDLRTYLDSLFPSKAGQQIEIR